jgi:hypothetical protein
VMPRPSSMLNLATRSPINAVWLSPRDLQQGQPHSRSSRSRNSDRPSAGAVLP